MRCAFHPWVIWLILGAISLNGAIPFQATPVTPAHSFLVPSAAMEASADGEEALFHATSSVSREFSLQCARQGKQVLALARALGFYALDREKAFRLHAVGGRIFSPLRIFPPRKIAPPVSENDPFLS